MRKNRDFFLCACVLFLAACTTQQPLSSVDRTKFRTIAADSNIKAPDHYIYRDTAGRRARGIAGGLVGLMIGAASEGPGYRRFDRAASRHPVEIKALVRSQIDEALETSRLFKVVKSNPDTILHLEILAYGIAPINGREHGGVISAQAELTSRDGKSLWKKIESGVSHTTAPLEGYEANTALWSQVAQEAAADLARKLILYSDTSERGLGPLAY